MSAIAGIVQFDGAPIEPGLTEKMTAAMARRGPDGVAHWVKGAVGLGQCMLRTTPESLDEIQPLTNEDESLVLAMDGRIDNLEDLRRELLARGAALRDRTDAELLLRAYETWGEDCPDRIIGEYVFFVWDARRRQLFGARDPGGTRHFYYHEGDGWFAFGSEIKGLLALGRIAPELNESRLLDYLVDDFDRDDEIGTFYRGVNRLPAGHAMRVTAQGATIWRHWNPGTLPPRTFASLDECAEAFLDQLRIAVKCRLRSNGPVAAMLSGGLDSSSIVGLIAKEFRDELKEPLHTISLIRDDRENCPDWRAIREVVKDRWLRPTIIASDLPTETNRSFLDRLAEADEPFWLTHGGLHAEIVYGAAADKGCKVVFDGAAGDLLFYGLDRSLDAIFRKRLFGLLPSVFAASRRHGLGTAESARTIARVWLASVAPAAVHEAYRRRQNQRAARAGDLALLRAETALKLRTERYASRYREKERLRDGNDQMRHAANFTSGLLSFAHEVGGEVALSCGVEPRSPLSDRRMIEFAIQMPVEAKLFAPWYKHTLRRCMQGMLPEPVRWRRTLGGNPGWKFYEGVSNEMLGAFANTEDLSRLYERLDKWVDADALKTASCSGSFESRFTLFRIAALSRWLIRRGLANA